MSIKPIKAIIFVHHTISAVVKSTCLWIVLRSYKKSYTIHQQKTFVRYKFTVFLNKTAIQKSKIWTDKNVLEIEILVKWALLGRYTNFHFSNYSLLKSVNVYKKQMSSLCKLYSVYGEIPEEFFDETDVVSYFYHNILDISRSHHRMVRVSKGSNKKSFAFKVFQFCGSKSQQRYTLKEEVSISKKEIESLLDTLGEILKAFDQANKVSQIPLPKPKFEIGFTKVKDELFGHCYKDVVEHLNRQTRLPCLKRTRLASFPLKFWTLRWSVHSYRSCQPRLPWNQSSLHELIFCCLQVWHFWEQLQCVTLSLLIVSLTIALLFSLETCIVQIQSVWVNFACTKRLFNLLAEAIINVLSAGLCARCTIFLLKIKQTHFSCRLVKGFTLLKRDQSQIKKLLEVCMVLESFVSTERNANPLVVM